MHSTVPLHPVANRRGDQSATVVAVDIDPAQQAERASAVHDATKSDPALAQGGGAASRPQLRRSPHSSGPTERQHTGTASDPEPSMVRPAADAPVWGLQHDDLSAYPIIEASPAAGLWNDAAAAGRKRATSTASAPHSYFYSGSSGMMEGDAPPLRKMSAAQFAELFARYAAVDVPHAVVFPFLHGVDGDNVSQNVFFGAPLTGMSAPRYRGLTVVRADMPAPGQRLLYHRRMRGASISSSKHSAGASFSNPRSRADSVATDTSESVQSSAHYSASSSSSDGHGAWGGGVNVPLSTTSSAHSVSSYGASLFSHRSGVGSHSLGSMTSISSSNGGEDGFFGDFQNKGGAVRFGNMQQQACRQPYEPQPGHSLLNSSVFPVELLVAPPSAASRSPKKDCNATLNTAPAALAGKRGGARARFVKPRQAQGVSLRNFKIQCAKYATISDIVLYCPAGLHEGMIELATWFRDAQDAWWEERQARGLGGLRYNVFLIEDPFETFEEHFPELISVDSAGRSANRVDFVDREREEMQRLTRASEIDTNVWLGSTGDVPMANGSSERIHLSNAFQAAEEARAANPHGFSICIEAHEAAEMPAASRLSHAADYLDALELICNRDRALLTGESGLGDMEELETETKSRSVLSLGPRGWSPPLRKRPSKSSAQNQRGSSSSSSAMTPSLVLPPLRIAPESMVMLESPVANQHEAQDANAQNKLAEDLIELCSWIKKQADPTAPAPQPPTTSSWMMRKSSEKEEPRSPRRVLLHCGDGYTETSVLALTYVMMSRRLCLPEAYLYLQKEMQRSFFVYARELPLLKRIEAKLQQRFPLNGSVGSGDRPKSNHGPADDVSSQHLAVADLEESVQIVEEHEASAPAPERSGWQRSLAAAASGLVSAIPNHKRHTSSSVSTSKPGGNTLSARAKTPTPASPQMSPVLQQAVRQEDKYPWFYDARFEGAFPSRILPFLYLGNLNHAMNAGMLHALGITHVVSVGESALSPADGALPPAALAPGNGDACGNSTLMRAASLWHERNAGRIGVLDLQNVSDDGIDPLRATMKQAVEYIENCRRSGGKVLVHCRVGVSRSSTIVLAYVMAHLDLSLVESYLLVRSRRLNILIQPHLLFFWELRSWETYLARQKLVRSRSNNVASREADGDILMGIAGELDRQGSWSGAAEDNFASLSLAKKSLEHLEASQEGSSADDEIDMDLALGAGSVHGTPTCDTPLFGAGSPQGLPSISLRLTWGFLAREIAHLNERYFQ